MKKEITRKYIYSAYGKKFTVCLGARFGNFLNRFAEPSFFTSGVYGWNSDIFTFGKICVSCGDRPFGNNNIKLQEITEKYINSNNKEDFEKFLLEITNYLNK